MNFRDMQNVQEAEQRAPPPTLVTAEHRRRHQQRLHHLDIAAADEHAMEQWRRRFPQDVRAEEEFYAQRKAERRAAQAERRAARAERHLRKEEAEAMVEAGVDIDTDSEVFNELWDEMSSDTISLGSDWDSE